MSRNSKQNPWVEVARRGRNQSLFVVEATAEAFQQGRVAKFHGFDFNPKSYRHFDGARWYRQADKEGWTEALRQSEQKRPGFLLETANRLYDAFVLARRKADALAQTDWAHASDEDLARGFDAFWQLQKPPFGALYDYIFLNFFYPESLFAKIAQKVPDVRRQNALFVQLTHPSDKSDLALEQQALAAIAQDAREKGTGSRRIAERIEEHARRFGYLNRYFYYKTDYTAGDILKRVQALLKTGPAKPAEPLDEPEWDDSVLLAARTIQRHAFVSSFENETFSYLASRLQPLFNQVSKRLGVSYMQLVHLRHWEILDALQNGMPESLYTKAAKRVDNVAVVLENGAITVQEGAALQNYFRQEKAETPSYAHLQEISGQSACPGQVSGSVCLILDSRDNDKIQKGQIMVAPTTYPALVPAMERAAAIITDEGGLLCHAAIVSRELGVPCIVGTKIATKVFQDGQRVEVDATAGTVKKV